MTSTSAPANQQCNLGGEDAAMKEEHKRALHWVGLGGRSRIANNCGGREEEGSHLQLRNIQLLDPEFCQFSLFPILVLLMPCLLSSIPVGSWSCKDSKRSTPLSLSSWPYLTCLASFSCFSEPQQDTLSKLVSLAKAKAHIHCGIPVPWVVRASREASAGRTCSLPRLVLFKLYILFKIPVYIKQIQEEQLLMCVYRVEVRSLPALLHENPDQNHWFGLIPLVYGL